MHSLHARPGRAAVLILVMCVGCGDVSWEPDGADHLRRDDIVQEHLPAGVRATAGAQPKVLFLNFNGVTLAWAATSDALANQTSVGSGGTIPPFTGDRQGVLSQVKAFFAAYDIQIVTSRPASGDYEMVVVGGDHSDIGHASPTWGVGPLDCGDVYGKGVGFVFSEEHQLPTPSKLVYELATTVAHEAGHLLGLLHPKDSCDVMSNEAYQLCPQSYAFLDQTSPLRPEDVGKCGGKTTQNSHKELLAVLGPAGGSSGAKPGGGAKPWLAKCSADQECQSNVCIKGESGMFCTRTCSPAEPCPGAWQCLNNVCTTQPPPAKPAAPYGSPCLSDQECAGGVCAVDRDGKGACSMFCDVSTSNCPFGATCQVTRYGAVCAPAPLPPPAAPGQTGGTVGHGAQGCRAGGGDDGGGPAAWAILLVGLFLRRARFSLGPGSHATRDRRAGAKTSRSAGTG